MLSDVPSSSVILLLCISSKVSLLMVLKFIQQTPKEERHFLCTQDDA
jgi:hypothetical protein